jgi:uncharacterized repeat protein (TIGR03803 family)
MLFSSWLRNWKASLERRSALNQSHRARPPAHRLAPRQRSVGLLLEQLENRITPSGSTLSTLASFQTSYGALPQALIMDSGGNLYGTTLEGGTSNKGTVFELARGSSTITTLASFNGTDGATPGSLILDSSGNLFGTTSAGGASNDGTVFELAKSSGMITTLASFNGTNGAIPAGLIMDSGGNLYGTTAAGGASGFGTVFELAQGSSTISTLASFNKTNGANPGSLILDSSGNLYGTTAGGGSSYPYAGTVFELAKGSSTITTLATFDITNGIGPQGLIMDGSGNLYGTTDGGGSSGYGTVFELAHGSGTITTLASFNGTDGNTPQASMVMDSSGNLYGTTENGGASNIGTVFELAQGSGTITTLATFNGTNGEEPAAGLIVDSSGNLYGTTGLGGTSNSGTVFELAKGSGTINTLASLKGFVYGANPTAGLIMDSSGNLYGTTYGGGAYADGSVFEVEQGSGTITTLASLNDANGAYPYTGLVMDSSGNLYGVAGYGGSLGDGTVFEVARGSGTITLLASFDGTNGSRPDSLILDSSGNLYGTTSAGGASNDGTVFELAKSSGMITTLASFNGTNGAGPGGLLMDGNGNLYGVTGGGGASFDGTIFELAKGSGTVTTLATFNGTNGQGPLQGLIMDGSGNLYGTTDYGGASGDGTVFELAKGSGTITTLASFTTPVQPAGNLILDSSGNLYGTTTIGGGDGTVFEVVKGSGTITTLASFNGANGADPSSGLIMDGSGNLYGTTEAGGPSNLGTVFELRGAVAPTIDQWTGANFGVDTNWSDGANWSTGTPPIFAQPVLFTNNSSVKDFTSTVDADFTSIIGNLDIDGTWGGTITVNNPLAIYGNFTLASGTFGGSGAVTIAGTQSQWTGGTIDVGSGGFTNTGTLTYSGSNNVVLSGSGSLINKKSIIQTSTGTLTLENGAMLNNAKGATYNIESNGGINQSGGGTLVNAGTLEKTKGTGITTIAASTLNNTGTVKESSGTLDISATVSQVSGNTLTAGTWTVTGSASVPATLDLTSVGNLTTIGTAAHVTLSGLKATFSNLSGLGTIDNGGSFSLLGGQSFTTAGTLTNNGSLTLSPGSILTVNGSFTQSSSSTLVIQLGGTNSAPTFGQLLSTTGSVTLAGDLQVTSTVVPAVGSSFEVLDNEGNAAISGAFANLPEGATFTVKKGTTTMVFRISYVGSDGDGSKNVVLTRIV